MPAEKSSQAQRPRELRRRVVIPARLRHGASWSDACIVNLSSRGLMIHTGREIAKGAEIELRRGDHVILARVMWREGGRAGLRADERVPVEDIMTLGQSSALRLTAATEERRKHPRPEEQSRLRGRAIEFAGVLVIGASLAGAGLAMVDAAFARPLALVSAALAP
jgi:PilZ domain-containing protein